MESAQMMHVQQPELLESEMDHGVASDASTDVEAPLSRTESQVVKQRKVEQVSRRLRERQHPVQDLAAATASLVASAPEGAAARTKALKEISQQQQIARNLGEDLLEDMLALDSLANLFPEDRLARKGALRDLEALTDKVDNSKSALLMRHRALEQFCSASEEEEEGTRDHTSVCDIHEDKCPSCHGEEDQADEDTEESTSIRQEARTFPRLSASEAASNVTTLPSAEHWAAMRVPLRLRAQTMPDGYVVVGSLTGLDSKDIEMALDDNDRSLLRLSGLRLPGTQETKALQSFVHRKLGGRPARLRDYLAAGDGVFGKIDEVIRLPEDVDLSAVQATCRDGQLRLVLPRRHLRPQPRGFNTRRSPRGPADHMAAFRQGMARSPRFPAW
eukprot:TRINITY_DN871_c0_g1_i2.p1 TRINITY_DN871_c0_g1~~TRINITY_DN871_c0_g1_i2.p1  ORF type:complete len:388 (+),score=78.68 TRINITY_DN871_c0_g1_i2:82-1245(+)